MLYYSSFFRVPKDWTWIPACYGNFPCEKAKKCSKANGGGLPCERIMAAIRRMRQARWLYKQQPLFAYHILCGIYPGYSHEEFMEDLRYRRPPKRRRGRNNLTRYGRYARMEQLADRYQQAGNAKDALLAMQLRRNLTKPYRVMVKVGKVRLEYTFSPLVPIRHIEELVGRLAACRSENEADSIVQDFRKTVHIG